MLKLLQGNFHLTVKLDQASVATRYPEDLVKLQNIYTQDVAREILAQTKEAIEWVKKTF